MTAYAPSPPIALPSCGKSGLPRQPPGHIQRQPLQQRLLGEACRLRLLVAPAGFGKSVLLADCARACPPEYTPLWLNCATWTGSAAAFCRQLASALGYPPALDEAQLGAALAAEERALWIMLNDYPREPDDALDACLDHLIGVSPANLNWWLGSRRRPNCNLPRLLLEGELFELDHRDLAFGAGEVGLWLHQVDPSRLAWADALHGMTAGWPAALRLRLLAAQGEREAGPALCEEHSSLLRDYIEHEVLHGLPADLLHALCQLAQIPRFSSALCEHLLGVGEGAEWLQALRVRGVFIDELEGAADWFEVFPPLAVLLQQRRKAEPCASLHLHASQWFAAQGDVRAAVEHALKGGQPEVAASFLERFTEEQLLQGQDLGLILRWRGELPESLLSSTPRLILLNAWVLLLVGRVDEAKACADQVARFQPRPDGERTSELFAQWQALSGIAACGRGYTATARMHLQEALQGLPEAAWAQALLCRSLLTQMAIGEGNLEAAQGLGYEALKQARRYGSPVFEALLELDHALLLEARGEFARGQTLLLRVLKQLDIQVLRQTPVWGRLHMRLGRLALRQGCIAEADELLRCGLAEALHYGDPGAFYGYLSLAELAAQQQDLPAAFARLAEAERLMQRQRVAETLYRGVLLLASSRLWMWQGHHDRARIALTRVLGYRQREQAMLPPPAFPELIPRLQHLLLCLDMAEGTDVRIALYALLEQSLTEGRQALASELWLSYAEACSACGEYTAAAQARQAGQSLRQRLNYQCLWFEAKVAAPGTASEVAVTADAPLSARELAVLRLIAQGCSNQEVAEQLFISLHTVKTHARRINGKLGVARRTQAVAQAKAQGLL
ncbi:LuxR C-terminal-related transcriptional regulator [Pseudomonas sp. UBA2684]|uniref:LuxR C-terminal-related transcriptional regulator n=1 Tax=Pseudomonas sp. UBA2684 TaxID=1947311 RepID=UPI000E7D6153|nr:LuxR C-terminal-related transcriptional regulator [Pseudomonas sp. UBA2684]HBX55626.1 helix-turn-helix transcriptional regulator [Pseudomonas sp.]|tara:strand:+ start:4420 stop:6960 length:2541 start_codon:yes stop_codon:yes gene_type:complete